ncbi:MAG TPA: hypothetical protein PLR88_13035, partial [Bacteroidales bacterium]|nr:hypothetical protein [Bacteroidales bacterium]
MKAINVLIFLFFIIASVQAYSQSSYFIGTSQASIEPDQSLISLHLGGYGAPRDGRFTLQWINKTPVPETVAMEGSDNKLFIAGKGNIMLMDLSENNSVWKSVARYDNIKAIAVADGKLLSMNNKGELLESKSLETIKWKTIGSVDESVVALSAAGNKLYAANGKGLMWVADLSGKSIVWTKLKTTNNIISIAANKEQLYALTGEGIIYKYQGGKDPQWLKIAYRNGVTIKEDIRHIAIVNDRLFGIS